MSQKIAGTWRGSPFSVGQLYRVISAGRWWYAIPKVGDTLRYDRSHYSRYDNSSAYVFVAGDGSEYWWFLHDDEPVEVWQQVFEAV